MGSPTSSTLVDLAPGSLLWFPGHAGFLPFASTEAGLMARQQLSGRGSPTHVLMIEDDPSIADMYRVQLEHDGYRVTVATTAELGFITVAENSPDLVLLDLLLPDRSGFEVLISNYAEPSMIDRGRSLGAVEYLVKSRVTPADISSQIPTWIAVGRRGGQGES